MYVRACWRVRIVVIVFLLPIFFFLFFFSFLFFFFSVSGSVLLVVAVVAVTVSVAVPCCYLRSLSFLSPGLLSDQPRRITRSSNAAEAAKTILTEHLDNYGDFQGCLCLQIRLSWRLTDQRW